MNDKLIFSAADFCLPAYAPTDGAWQKWAVIACDQFTSEPAYWAEAEAIAAGAPSALELILPEVYLGTAGEEPRKAKIAAAMNALGGSLKVYENSMLYLERTLPDGRVRRGLVGKIDLEAYDYSVGSASAVRATEATVVSRIPPRVAIRRAADYELPHVMVLLGDGCPLMAHLAAHRDEYELLYDFELMLGGGRAAGRRLVGASLAAAEEIICAYEASLAGGLVYAMGDGNHSLASAKAHYEALKKELGEAAADHPARWALVELVALDDPALDFEPIYRVTKGGSAALLAALDSVTEAGEGEQSVTVITAAGERTVFFTNPTHALTVGTLQDFLDAFIADHPETECDYIHDESSLRALAADDDAVGFLFAGMEKEELFPYVCAHGTLPRKTFSMGEARSKRYYLEARRIVK